ncbi:hypothetical protein MBLNU13_g05305t1 [Cladosporium sp. NU13]
MDLARAMRAWIAFGDEEEQEKKEKEEDAKALDRSGRKASQPTGGDDTNPITVDDESNVQPLDQTVVDPLENLQHPKPDEQPNAADHTTPIVELLHKRQREEREEADIRREEQVLLDKRLALMEEQVQMLSKLITKHNPPQVDVAENDSAEVFAGPEMETEAAATSGAVHDSIVIDDDPAEKALDEESTNKSVAMAGLVEADTDRDTADKITDVSANERPDTSLEPGASAGAGDTAIHKVTTDDSANIPADFAMDNSAEPPDAPPAELWTTTSIGTTEIHNSDAHATNDAAENSLTANAHKAIGAAT